MGILTEKIAEAGEFFSGLWKDRLRGWMASWVMKGMTGLLSSIELEYSDDTKSTLQQMRDNPETPPEMREVLDRLLTPGSSAPFPAIVAIIIAMFGGMAISQFAPTFKKIGYTVSHMARDYRLNPAEVITAWRRDPEAYEQYFEDLREQGWSDERLEVLKFVTQYYPSPGDLVRWQAREVFEEDMVTKYGLDDELEGITKEPFYKAGMDDEQIRNYWRAHWEHASWNQVVEMLRRGQLTEDDVRDWFRLVEIPPFWRDKLLATSWAVPTRVDVRRFWDMRTIDEARLREIYTWQGYHGKDLDDYILWTKVYTDFPVLLNRWKNGWITIDEVRSRLLDMGMPAERVDELLQEKVKSEEDERVTGEKNLTKTDIIKGVKTGVITYDEGLELLIDLNYDEDEADYILQINVAAPEDIVDLVKTRDLTKADILNAMKKDVLTISQARDMLIDLDYTSEQADILILVKLGVSSFEDLPGVLAGASPRDYAGFKALTQKYRIATGKEGKPVPQELKQAADKLVLLTNHVEDLKNSLATAERELIPDDILPAETTEKRDELRRILANAERELARAQDDYNILKAQYEHGD